MKEVTLEQWMQTYQEAESLKDAIIDKLDEIYGETIWKEWRAVKNDFFKKMHDQGETFESLHKVSAYHAIIGSTIFPEFFNLGESMADLEGDKSILKYFKNKLRELESA